MRCGRYMGVPRVMDVLEKLRRFQGIVRAHGRYQLEFKQLLAGDDLAATQVNSQIGLAASANPVCTTIHLQYAQSRQLVACTAGDHA